ncbi:MAG: ABC transporter substrate-binding protein [Candidatus Thorarchaeota archaeon]
MNGRRTSRERKIDALIIVGIILSSSIIFLPLILPEPPTPPPETILRILSVFDVTILSTLEDSFLDSPFAEDNNIVDIDWVGVDTTVWDILIRSSSNDLVLGPWDIINSLGQAGFLHPIAESTHMIVNESIAGVTLKGHTENQTVWCSVATRNTIFELLVNDTLLSEYGLEVPETFEELLSPAYYAEDLGFSLIGLDDPSSGSVGYQLQNFLTKAYSWEDGIRNLTLLFANSMLYSHQGDALEALFGGDTAVAITVFNAQDSEPLPITIQRMHLQNMVIVNPTAVAISNESKHVSQSEAFIEFLLSPDGQKIWLEQTNLFPVRREAFDMVGEEIDERIFSEFNWTSRTTGFGVSKTYTDESIALGVYMDSTAIVPYSNLTHCWRSIVDACNNGSIDELHLRNFATELGEPITFLSPINGENETFTREYAIEIQYTLYGEPYAEMFILLWRETANLRYERIFNELSALL